jgi:hypothetical protein
MSAKHLGEVFQLDLPHEDAWILMALANHADKDGKNAYPSVARLQHETGYSLRKVTAALARLQAAGIIECSEHNVSSGRPNIWSLHLDRAPRKPAFMPAKRRGREPRAATHQIDQDAHEMMNRVDQHARKVIDHQRSQVDQHARGVIDGVDQNTRKVCAKPSLTRRTCRALRMKPSTLRRHEQLKRERTKKKAKLAQLIAPVRTRRQDAGMA